MTVPPVRVGIVRAIDDPWSPAQYAATKDFVQQATDMLRQVISRETRARAIPHAMDFDIRIWQSQLTVQQMQTNPDGTMQRDSACTAMGDGTYEGFSQNTLLLDLEAGLGWNNKEDPTMGGRNARWAAIQPSRGGGVAGGSFQVDNWDGTLPWPVWSFGLIVMGGWGLWLPIVGEGSPCCIEKYGVGFCEPLRPLDDLSHEFYHSFAMDSHNPYIRGLDPWSEQQYNDFMLHNAQFLYPVEAPVPEPTPIPTVRDIQIEPDPVQVRVGQTIDIDTWTIYSDGSLPTNINHMDTLSILNARIASVDSEANTLTGLRQGTTELLVTYAGGLVQKHVPVAVKKRWWRL